MEQNNGLYALDYRKNYLLASLTTAASPFGI